MENLNFNSFEQLNKNELKEIQGGKDIYIQVGDEWIVIEEGD